MPGYLQSMVRSIGRQAFAPFTDTPIEQISVLAHLEAGHQAARFGVPGNRPNQIAKINAMAGWIQRNRVRDDAATLDIT